MEKFVANTIDFSNDFISKSVDSVTRSRTTTIILSSLGIVSGVYLSTKWTVQYNQRRKVLARLQAQKEELKANKNYFREKYNLVTVDQQVILNHSFEDLKSKLQSGDLTALEVLEAYLSQAVSVDLKTNAVTEFIEEALERARELDLIPKEERGPLHGIPISLKEMIHLKNKECTAGIPAMIGEPVSEDAELVKLLKISGAIPFCRTNLPQTCFSYECSNPIYGTTTNFHNSKLSPGGSSGGEGALIAGGGSIIGIGSDLGGSVRIPAAFCGITSLKPTSGRLPLKGQGLDGAVPGAVGVFNTLGFMGQTAAGIEECMRSVLTNVAQCCDARLVPVPWDEEKMRKEKKLKIGWYNYDGCIVATPGFHRAVDETLHILRQNGHEVVEFDASKYLPRLFQLWGLLLTADDWKNTYKKLSYGPIDKQSIGVHHFICGIPLVVRKLMSSFVALKSPMIASGLGSQCMSGQSWQLMDLHAERIQATDMFLKAIRDEELDVLIAPGFAVPALPLGYPAHLLAAVSYTGVYNLLNFPIGSITVRKVTEADQVELDRSYPGFETDLVYGWLKEGTSQATGMPLNVQVISTPWNEELVLRVMLEIEESMKKS